MEEIIKKLKEYVKKMGIKCFYVDTHENYFLEDKEGNEYTYATFQDEVLWQWEDRLTYPEFFKYVLGKEV